MDEQPPEPPAPPHPRRRTVVWVIVLTQMALALLTGTAVTAAYRHLDGNIETLPAVPDGVERPEEVAVDGPRKPLNILVMGIDSREGDNAIDGEAGLGGTDVAMLLHVSADRQDAYGISLPRDAIVDRPDCIAPDGGTVPGERASMFNDAFVVGGSTCTIQLVEALTDVRVHHAVVVDFTGFKAMVDAVNGVEVCLPKEVDDPERQIFLPAGTHLFDGEQSLAYVRERYVLSLTGDIGRMKRQQAFVASMINRVMSAETLTRPDRVVRFLDAATESLELDEELDSIPELTDLVRQFQDIGLDQIRFLTVPIEEYPLDANRLQWAPAASQLWQRVRRDLPLGRTFADDSISAAKPPTGRPSPSGSGTPGRPSSGSSADPGPDGGQDDEASAAAAAAGLCG